MEAIQGSSGPFLEKEVCDGSSSTLTPTPTPPTPCNIISTHATCHLSAWAAVWPVIFLMTSRLHHDLSLWERATSLCVAPLDQCALGHHKLPTRKHTETAQLVVIASISPCPGGWPWKQILKVYGERAEGFFVYKHMQFECANVWMYKDKIRKDKLETDIWVTEL